MALKIIWSLILLNQFLENITNMKVATVSFNSIWEDKEANLIQFERIVKSLKLKVEIVIFPEMTFTGFWLSNLELAEDLTSSFLIKKIKKIAQENQMNIKFGLMTSRGNEKYNSCISINKNGEIESIFDKMHLFSFSGEDHFITGGTNLKSINW